MGAPALLAHLMVVTCVCGRSESVRALAAAPYGGDSFVEPAPLPGPCSILSEHIAIDFSHFDGRSALAQVSARYTVANRSVDAAPLEFARHEGTARLVRVSLDGNVQGAAMLATDAQASLRVAVPPGEHAVEVVSQGLTEKQTGGQLAQFAVRYALQSRTDTGPLSIELSIPSGFALCQNSSSAFAKTSDTTFLASVAARDRVDPVITCVTPRATSHRWLWVLQALACLMAVTAPWYITRLLRPRQANEGRVTLKRTLGSAALSIGLVLALPLAAVVVHLARVKHLTNAAPALSVTIGAWIVGTLSTVVAHRRTSSTRATSDGSPSA